MDSKLLSGKRVAVLATNGFEESELFSPRAALLEAGADVDLVSPETGKIRAWKNKDWGKSVPVDVLLEDAEAADYDAILLPGGVMNPDQLRKDQKAVDFVREFFESGKPIAAICHGPQLLIEAGVVDGLTMTSYSSIRKDLENAGANWVDEEVVVDRSLVTSRSPEDLPAFNDVMITAFSTDFSDVPRVPARMTDYGERPQHASH
jgi:protease I